MSSSERPSGVHVAVQPTEAMVQSIVPRRSVTTGSSVISGVTVQPSAVSSISSSPYVAAYWTPTMPVGSGLPRLYVAPLAVVKSAPVSPGALPLARAAENSAAPNDVLIGESLISGIFERMALRKVNFVPASECTRSGRSALPHTLAPMVGFWYADGKRIASSAAFICPHGVNVTLPVWSVFIVPMGPLTLDGISPVAVSHSAVMPSAS